MATHQAADMEPNLTECAVCNELFNIPKLLPCSHILCRGCLVTWLQSQPQAGCPLCRCAIMGPVEHKGRSVEEVVDGFPTDLAMSAMVEAETLLSKQHVCCVCVNVAAVALCLQCGETFCQNCSNLHQKQTATKHHEVEQLNSLTTERLATHHPATCPIHQDKVSEVYCPSHDASVCVLCATTTHRECTKVVSSNTKIGELTAELFQLHKQLTEVVTDSDNLVQRLDKRVQEIERDSQASLTELRNVCDRLKAAIDVRFLSVKTETVDFVSNVTKKVTDFKKHVIQTRSKTVTQKKMTELYGKFTEHKHFKDMVTIVQDRKKEIVKVDDPPDNLQLNYKLIISIDPQIVADIERNLYKLGDRSFTPNDTKSKAPATKSAVQCKDRVREQQVQGDLQPDMAFDFSEWANNLPHEAREKLVEHGYDELSALRASTENVIREIITKQSHKKVVWENIKRLQETSLPGTKVSSKLITRTKAELKFNNPNEIRIILSGRTGAGKSSIGNAILGVQSPTTTDEPGFTEYFGQGSGTKNCKMQAVRINGRTVRVIDTPGFCDTHRDPTEVLFEVSKSLLLTSPGPHIFLFVVNGQCRFTREEYDAYLQLRNMFDSTLVRYISIAFTHCECLNDGRKVLEQLFEASKRQCEKAKKEGRDPPDINKVLDDVNRRYIIMYTRGNEEKRDQQIVELLKMVDDMQAVNPSPYFQDDKVRETTKQMDLRLQLIMREKGIRDKAKAWEILVEELQQGNLLAKAKSETRRALVVGAAAEASSVKDGCCVM